MQRIKFLVVVILILSGGTTALHAQSPPFPTNHWVYDFLERMEVKGILTNIFDGTRPMSRDEIAGYLSQILSDPQSLTRLNSVEKRQLHYLTLEFRDYLAPEFREKALKAAPRLMKYRRMGFLSKIFPNHLYTNGRNLFQYSEEDFLAVLDPVLYRSGFWAKTDTGTSARRDFRDTHGVTSWGRWGKHLSFYFDFRDSKIWGSRKYPVGDNYSLPGIGYTRSFGSYVDFDETQAGIIVGGKHWQVTLGKERNAWGPGYWGSLAISDNPTSYDQVKLQVRFRKFKFTSISGILRPCPNLVAYSYYTGYFQRDILSRKYMAAHRLDVAPFRFLKIGFQEVLIYGERNPEIGYVNPINYYWSEEHNLGDQDNSTIGATFQLLPGFSSKIYGELFIDDLKTSKLGTGWYGNKWAVLVGAFRADLFSVPNLDARIEYVRIRPYVYTHRYPVNRFENFATPLGYWTGPNSETLTGLLSYRFSRWGTIGVQSMIWKHGANPPGQNAGGDLQLPHRVFDPIQARTLGGDLETRIHTSATVSYEWFRNFVTRFEIRSIRGKNVVLNTGRRGDINTWGGFVAVGFNY